MSSSGEYILLTNKRNDEQTKRFILTKVLNKRIDNYKKKICKKEPWRVGSSPTLSWVKQTHQFFLCQQYKPFANIAYEYIELPSLTSGINFGSTVRFRLLSTGNFLNDMFLRINLGELNAGPTATTVSYANFLAHRLIKNITLELAHYPITSYDSHVMNYHYNLRVPSTKKNAWKRCVGQQVEEPILVDQGDDENAEIHYTVNGLQTFKNSHGETELILPLIFWFNLSPEESLPTYLMEFGQNFIIVELATAEEVIRSSPTVDFITPTIDLSLFGKYYYIDDDVADNIKDNFNNLLIRTYRIEDKLLNSANGRILIDSFKYPTEYLYVSFRPEINDEPHTWNLYGIRSNDIVAFPATIPNAVPPPDYILVIKTATVSKLDRIVDNLGIESKGTILWNDFNTDLYQNYLPQNLKNLNVADEGIYFVPFNSKPYDFDPSGFFNMSGNREFYIKYNSTIISNVFRVNMHAVSVGLNFIEIVNKIPNLLYTK